MASSTREIVTLQVGHFANFVGTHWWNLQESTFSYDPDQSEPKEINHDVLFREGQNLMGEVTFTPRLISVDTKGALNTLKQEGSLYDIGGHDDVQWDSDVTLHKLDVPNKNEFLKDLEEEYTTEATAKSGEEKEADMDESQSESSGGGASSKKIYKLNQSVSVWSDFLRVHLHPRTVHLLNEYQHNNDLQRFDMFGYGKQAMSSEKERDGLEDRVHYFLEECDSLQGMHLLVDTHDGFGGLGASLIQQIQDDYSSNGFTVFGLSPPSFHHDSHNNRAVRLLNSVMSFDGLISSGSAYVPLCTNTSYWGPMNGHTQIPYLDYMPELWYHSSAILAAGMDTTTLPYRLHNNPSIMSHLTDAMTGGGRKLLGLQTSLPLPIGFEDTLVTNMMAMEELPWRPLTPMFSSTTDPYAQSVVLRGIKPNRIKGAINERMPSEIRAAKTADDILEIYLRDKCTNSLSAGCALKEALNVSAPFPHIFDPKVNVWGNIDTQDRDTNIGVDSVPMMTSLQSSISAIDHLQDLIKRSSKLNIKKYNSFIQSGVEIDDYNEAVQNLETLTQSYRANVESLH